MNYRGEQLITLINYSQMTNIFLTNLLLVQTTYHESIIDFNGKLIMIGSGMSESGNNKHWGRRFDRDRKLRDQ